MSSNGRSGVLESEVEDELEVEDEYEFEGEDEDEQFLGGLVSGISGLLGEDEFEGEDEDEFEGEDEDEQFLGGLLGQSEDEDEYEYEGEDEYEEFFGKIGGFLRKAAPLLKSVAKVAAPMVGTALLGPLGGTIGGIAANALGEDEDEFEAEMEDEDEAEAEAEAAVRAPMTRSDAIAEMMASIASQAESEEEAEAMIGAATATVLSRRDRRELRRLLPHMVRATAILTRILRRRRATRPAVRLVPAIVVRTSNELQRRARSGAPVTRRTAARVMAKQTRAVLSRPRATSTALRRNMRAQRAMTRPRSAAPAARVRRNPNALPRRRAAVR